MLSSLHRGPAHGQKQQPSAKLQQCLSISLACSPSALHAVPSAAPNPSICPTGCWQEATAVFLQPNLDWPTLSFFFFLSGGPSFHSFPCMDEVAFLQRHLHGNGNYSGSGPALETEQTRRGETCRRMTLGQNPGQLEWDGKLDRNINSIHTQKEANTGLCSC